MSNPFISVQEAASSPLDATKNSPSDGFWAPPSHELDHLLQAAAPKTRCEEVRESADGHDSPIPLERHTPFTSPLGNEALLNRPASLLSTSETPDVTPVSSANRSLAALLDKYRSAISLVPSSLVTFGNEHESPSEVQVRNALTADFVADITVPDGQNFPPGAEFVKCWRMMNDGDSDWPDSTELVFVAGTTLFMENSSKSVKVGSVKAGTEIDLWTQELKVRTTVSA